MTDKPQERSSFKKILKPRMIKEWTIIWKDLGFWGFVKKKGWRIVITVFLFYLIRDSLLYIVLPYFAARGLLGC